MGKTPHDYRVKAKELLEHSYKKPAIVMYFTTIVFAGVIVLYYLAYVNPNSVRMDSIGLISRSFADILLYVYVFATGYVLYTVNYLGLSIVKKRLRSTKEVLTAAFKRDLLNSLILRLFMVIFTFFCLLLLIIPGIIISYAYSMSFYLMNKVGHLKASQAMGRSINLMKGHKKELFLLDLSFVGDYLVGILTLGYTLHKVIPQHVIARTLFFEDRYFAVYGEDKLRNKSKILEYYNRKNWD